MKFLELFRNWKDVVEFDAQTVIFPAGSPAEALYFIVSGKIELSLHGETLSTEGAGSIIGEMAMIPSATQCTTATTLSGVTLARFDHSQLKELVDKNSEFSLHMMAVLASRLRAVDKFISTQMSQSSNRFAK
jgi:CRP/FNR family cyclic AMP-dependent transcriptional regulator